jgi:hypothetical protein
MTEQFRPELFDDSAIVNKKIVYFRTVNSIDINECFFYNTRIFFCTSIVGVPVKCEAKRETKYTETKPNETKLVLHLALTKWLIHRLLTAKHHCGTSVIFQLYCAEWRNENDCCVGDSFLYTWWCSDNQGPIFDYLSGIWGILFVTTVWKQQSFSFRHSAQYSWNVTDVPTVVFSSQQSMNQSFRHC